MNIFYLLLQEDVGIDLKLLDQDVRNLLAQVSKKERNDQCYNGQRKMVIMRDLKISGSRIDLLNVSFSLFFDRCLPIQH